MTPAVALQTLEVRRNSGSINTKILAFGPIAGAFTVSASIVSGYNAWSATVPRSAILIALIAVILGVPHGAVDHLTLTAQLSRSARLLAAAGYAVVAIVSTALILAAPATLFVVVLAMSVWHFGAGDVEAVADLGNAARHDKRLRRLQVLAAGSAPVLLPLTSSSAGSTLGLIHPDLAAAFTPVVTTSVRIAVLVLVVVTLTALGRRRDWNAVGELLVLTILGLVATPLVAFGVYFATWHALRHTARLAQDEHHEVHWIALARVFFAGLPALALTCVAVIAWAIFSSGATVLGTWLWFALAAVWGLTVPHMIAVSRFDRSRRKYSQPTLK